MSLRSLFRPKKFDVVAIGDIVVDAFIKLSDAHLSCDIHQEHCQICLDFGGKVPYESVTTIPACGNSPNVAVALSRLGQQVALISNLGQDDNGELCIHQLKTEGIETKHITTHPNLPTNLHYVLWYGNDRTILVQHKNYPYDLLSIPQTDWIYLSSLGNNADKIYQKLNYFLQKNPRVKLAFSPGTFQLKLGPERLHPFYERAEILFVNKEEAEKIVGRESDDILSLAQDLRELGPRVIVITDAEHGAYCLYDNNWLHLPSFTLDQEPLERTGAGDAFAGAFLSAIIADRSINEAMRWGVVNSASVINQIGPQAGLLTANQLAILLGNCPTPTITTV